jgi:hypothetical protein
VAQFVEVVEVIHGNHGSRKIVVDHFISFPWLAAPAIAGHLGMAKEHMNE